ncbi:MAG: TetR/AcrR family transcriptional regulator [Candidatus Eisenbacteria bacterium]|uniref:TetR/AcrR family transcriptional regulator n=1 Tax=Eiseniibacteriota bacterium TaxID=2212470 RepID=A0A956LWN5_UNCEI|nr:TetR/AcrR family transcriptional regulator [Candidatus Eisenbacteria bacterium]
MPRSKEFDPEVVLDRATDLFWKKGYEATSIKDLVGYMRINRFSLYSTFGDKQHLFLAACDRYEQHRGEDSLSIMEKSEDGLPCIRRYLESLVERFTAEEGSRGCFMTNTTVELAPHDSRAAEKTGAYLHRLQAAFYHALGRAHQRGEITSSPSINDYARFLTSTAQGMAVLAKVSPKREILDAIVNVSMSALH